ncbi:hypothetical protein JTB14_024801 [Gonioctena quinquepunctata]|nr:hypothetical protein JTB14_024801 [Gonioctena quinquepunctata]
MPPVRGKVKKYSLEDMQQAIEAVRHGTSVAAASKQFKIPRITLLYKVKGKYGVYCRMGPKVHTSDEEGLLVRWLLAIADEGFPATRLELLDSVQMLMQKLNRPNKFESNRLGKIIELDAENAETKVSTLMRSGMQDWKWPNHEDIMWYKNSDIIRKIKALTPKNSRGIYAVLEMKTYHQIFQILFCIFQNM